MLSKEVISNIKPGDVGFIMHHDNKISRLIAWFMNSKWGHSFIVYKVIGDEIFIIETCDYAVGIYTMDDYLKGPHVELEILSHPDMTDEERSVVVAGAKKTLKNGYGYLQLISFAIEIALSKIGIKVGHFVRWGLVCIHVVTYGYALSKREGFAGMDAESVQTEEAYKMFKAAGFIPVFKKEKDIKAET